MNNNNNNCIVHKKHGHTFCTRRHSGYIDVCNKFKHVKLILNGVNNNKDRDVKHVNTKICAYIILNV